MIPASLLPHIRTVAHELPPSVLESVIAQLTHPSNASADTRFTSGTHSAFDLNQLKHQIFQRLPHTRWRQVMGALWDHWQTQAPDLHQDAIALALSTARFCDTEHRKDLSLELVWTGPDGSSIPVRRTEQVLLQLIQSAQHDLTLVSFAVYKVDDIAQALLAAIARGVSVRIIAETPEETDAPVPFGVKAGLGHEVAQKAQIFTWDRSQRPTDENGRCGSLHAKCAIADHSKLFITSANLTGYALSLNMELGILINNESLSSKVTQQLNDLIDKNILTLLSFDGISH